MKVTILFKEQQRFRQWWIWLILLGINGLILFGIWQQVILGKPFGNNPASNGVMLFIAVMSLLMTVFFMSVRLETIVDEHGVSIRFFPFHRKLHRFPWQQITKAYVRQYQPIREYGGWGLRTGGSKHGKALNVSGDMGLQLELDNGERLLIGTQKPDELRLLIPKGKASDA